MKKNSFTKSIVGGAIILIGVSILLSNLGITHFGYYSIWQILWVSFTLALGVKSLHSKSWIWATLWLSISASSTLSILNIIDISFWKFFWPVIIILVGINLLFGLDKIKNSSKDEISAFFWGTESKIEDNFDGTTIYTFFGGVDLDLRNAQITDKSVINVYTMFGGTTIKLPRDTIAKVQVQGFLGGAEDNTNPDKNAKKKLIIRGSCIFGGVEVI